MQILAVVALGGLLCTSIEAHGGAIREAHAMVSNTTAISISDTITKDSSSAAPTSFLSLKIQDTVTVTRSVIVNPLPSARPSLDRTVTVTKSISLANSPMSAKPSSTPNPLKACWATGECRKALIEFAGAYNASGNIIDPNEHDSSGHDQSHKFRDQLCIVQQYDNTVSGKSEKERPMNFLMCMSCFKAAGLDTNTESGQTLDLIYKIDGFCHTNWPNAFNLLDHLLYFMMKSEAPRSIAELPVYITGQVPGLKTQFTWTSDINRRTSDAASTMPISTTGTNSPPDSTSNPFLPWSGSPLTPGAPLPASLLEQVPAKWPFTEYSMLNKVGPLASMPLTAIALHASNATMTVAWLYHSLVWNPKPLYTPPSAHLQSDTLYQPLLESWTRAATWVTTPGTTRETSHSTTTQQRSQGPGALSEPTITQSPVLSLEPYAPGEILFPTKSWRRRRYQGRMRVKVRVRKGEETWVRQP